jgi:hypothetical protein
LLVPFLHGRPQLDFPDLRAAEAISHLDHLLLLVIENPVLTRPKAGNDGMGWAVAAACFDAC